jgi:phosphomevalonate kinase
MREMGQLSGVEIEPEQQTRLLDASVSMAGVIGGGVPGGKFVLLSFYFCPFDTPFFFWHFLLPIFDTYPSKKKKKAGGFDAVWLLVCEPPEDTPGIPPLPRIERLWTSFPGVAPLLAQESKARGVTLERIDDVPGLAAVVTQTS